MEELRFTTSFQKLLSCSAIVFIGLAESRETSESTFHVRNTHNKPQAAIPSTFKMEVKQISPFYILQLRRSLTSNQSDRQQNQKQANKRNCFTFLKRLHLNIANDATQKANPSHFTNHMLITTGILKCNGNSSIDVLVNL